MDAGMCLMYAGVVLKNDDQIKTLKLPIGATMTQSKSDLSEIKGLVVSYDEPDIIFNMPIEEGAAKMCCGHVISTESMTAFVRSIVDYNKYEIKCPAMKPTGGLCLAEWEYTLCRKIG